MICLNPFLWSEGAGFVLAGFLDSQTWKNSPRSKESANIYPSYEINSEVQNLEILQKKSKLSPYSNYEVEKIAFKDTSLA